MTEFERRVLVWFVNLIPVLTILSRHTNERILQGRSSVLNIIALALICSISRRVAENPTHVMSSVKD